MSKMRHLSANPSPRSKRWKIHQAMTGYSVVFREFDDKLGRPTTTHRHRISMNANFTYSFYFPMAPMQYATRLTPPLLTVNVAICPNIVLPHRRKKRRGVFRFYHPNRLFVQVIMSSSLRRERKIHLTYYHWNIGVRKEIRRTVKFVLIADNHFRTPFYRWNSVSYFRIFFSSL